MDYTTLSPCDVDPNVSNECKYISSHNTSLNTSLNGDTSSTSINKTLSSSSPKTSDLYEGLATYALGYWYVHPYLSLLICVFGISSNIINIIILTQKKMLNPINCVLTGIAVSDIITMADYVPFVIHFYLRTGLEDRVNRYTYFWSHYLAVHSCLSNTTHTISMWLAVCMSAMSYIAAASAPIQAFLEFLLPVLSTIFFQSHCLLSNKTIVETIVSGERGMNPVEITIINPRKEIGRAGDRRQSLKEIGYVFIRTRGNSRWNLSIKKTILIIILVYVTSVVVFIPNYLVTKVKPMVMPALNNATIYKLENLQIYLKNSSTVNTINVWLFILIGKLLPCMFMCLFGGLLLQTLGESKKLSKSLKQTSCSQRMRAHKRTTTMLLAIVLMFLLAELPSGVLVFVSAYVEGFFMDYYLLFADTIDILSLINNSVNFIMYCSMSRQFRECLYETVPCLDELTKRQYHAANGNKSHTHVTQL